MSGIESQIAGSEKLTRIYGGWPTFHDAEVIELRHWRGQMKPGAEWDESNVLPTLTVTIHVFIELSGSQHTLATLKFEDVDEYRMEGFNHQNAILSLAIVARDREKIAGFQELPPDFAVEFESAFGMSASFRCSRIEVVDAVPCTADDKVLPEADE